MFRSGFGVLVNKVYGALLFFSLKICVLVLCNSCNQCRDEP